MIHSTYNAERPALDVLPHAFNLNREPVWKNLWCLISKIQGSIDDGFFSGRTSEAPHVNDSFLGLLFYT
jgi:hypothetical protein